MATVHDLGIDGPRAPALARLLEQNAWIRKLAARVGGADADDLVQDVFVAALQRPPDDHDGMRLRGWIRAVVHRLAARNGRAAARRRRREAEAASSASRTDDPAAELEHVRLHREIAAAVLQLDEPYRTAIAWRYYEGLDYAVIAARFGVTPAAARQRVTRGVAALRARLGGHRRERALALAPAALWRRGRRAAVSACSAGGLIVGTVTKWSLAGAVLAAVAAVGWPMLRTPEAQPPHGSATADPLAAHAQSGEPASPVPAPAREEVAAAAPASPEPPAPAGPPARLRGRIFDEEHLAVAPPGSVQITVVADAGGARATFDAQLDAFGAFTFEELPPGRVVRVWARTKGHAMLETAFDRQLWSGAEAVIELCMSRGATVTGVVLDGESGQPVAGAHVWCEDWQFVPNGPGPTAITDAAGRFRLSGVTPRRHTTESGMVFAVISLMAESDRHLAQRNRAVVAQWSEDGRYDFELRIDPAPCAVHGVVVDASGTPKPGFVVYAIDAQANLRLQVSNADGSFDVAPLARGPLALCAFSNSRGDLKDAFAGTTTVQVETSGTTQCQLVVGEPRVTIGGVVRDRDGRPCAGVEMAVHLRYIAHGLGMPIGEIAAATGADGRFLVERLPAGQYLIEPKVGAEMVGLPCSYERDVADSQAAVDLDFVLEPAIEVAGRVELGGRAHDDLEVALREGRGGAHVAAARLEIDGAFELRAPARAYELLLVRGGKETIARVPVGPGPSRGIVLRPAD
jgi:RNA polymerase sigma-70 factor (ECF subfamily)